MRQGNLWNVDWTMLLDCALLARHSLHLATGNSEEAACFGCCRHEYTEDRMYQLTVHDQITDYENRMDAVTAAKDLTGRPDGPVTATVTDGVERLDFRDGKLVAYTYETRRTDRRRRPEEAPELEQDEAIEDAE